MNYHSLAAGMAVAVALVTAGVSAEDVNVTGVVISSLCFGILHMSDTQQWPYVVWATAVGLLLGYSAVATGNLLVPIVAHVFTNLISSCIWKLERA